MTPQGATRRGVLRGAGALALAAIAGTAAVPALAGCTPAASTEIPGAAELTDVIKGTAALADTYDAAITAYPALATRLTPLRDAHRAHVAALASMLGQDPPPAATQPAPGTSQGSALSALAAAEKAGRAAAVAACLAAPARLAPLLGSIAAARASHQEALK